MEYSFSQKPTRWFLTIATTYPGNKQELRSALNKIISISRFDQQNNFQAHLIHGPVDFLSRYLDLLISKTSPPDPVFNYTREAGAYSIVFKHPHSSQYKRAPAVAFNCYEMKV